MRTWSSLSSLLRYRICHDSCKEIRVWLHNDGHVIDEGIVNAHRCKYEVFLVYVRVFRGCCTLGFIFMADNAKPNRVHIVDNMFKKKIFAV